MPKDSTHQGPRWSALRIPPINPRFGLVILPVLVFLLVRRVATPEIAISAGFLTSLIVFFINRQSGRTGILAVLGMVIVGGAAIVGIVLGSEKAYLMNDPISDYLIMTVALVSIILRRPLFSLFARELVPAVERVLEPRHSVFYLTTWLLVAVNAVQGTTRVVLLQNLSVDYYLLVTKPMGWTLSFALLVATYVLIDRAVRRSVQFTAMLAEEDTVDADNPRS
jgi:hypothetical protein